MRPRAAAPSRDPSPPFAVSPLLAFERVMRNAGTRAGDRRSPARPYSDPIWKYQLSFTSALSPSILVEISPALPGPRPRGFEAIVPRLFRQASRWSAEEESWKEREARIQAAV